MAGSRPRLIASAGAGLLLALLAAPSSGLPARAAPGPPPRPATLTPVPSAAAQSTPAASEQASRPTGAEQGLVRAAGLQQWLGCGGAGPLTLVVIPGLGASSGQWSAALPALRRITRVCIADRPGLGHSPARPPGAGATDAGAQAAELHALLAAAGEPGPYAVLGHSYGGLVARAFARQHPDEVAAVLLMEGVDPSAGGAASWHEAGQAIDMRRSRAAAGNGPRLGALPLVVLSASAPSGDHLRDPKAAFGPLAMTRWLREQRASTRLSANALWVVAHAGHVVQQDNPRAVAQAVRALLASAATGQRLRCTPAWSRVDARCEPSSG